MEKALRIIVFFQNIGYNSVSAGPLYVCTCCVQLWYKHSVYPAGKMKLNNLNLVSTYKMLKVLINDVK